MKRLFLFLADVAIFYLALLATLYLRYGSNFGEQYELHKLPFAITFFLWFFTFYIAGMYDISSLRNTPKFYSAYFKAIATAGILSGLLFYLIPALIIAPKTNLVIFTAIFIAINSPLRILFNEIVSTKFKRNILLVGVSSQSLELAEFITANPQTGYSVAGLVNISPGDIHKSGAFKILNGGDGMGQILSEDKIDIVVVSPEAYQQPELVDTFFKALSTHIRFLNLASFYERLTDRIPLEAIDQLWFLENFQSGTARLYNGAKRVSDIIAAIILGTLSLPFYPFIFLLLALDEGKGFFSIQKRVGYGNQITKLYKFRTMLIANDEGAWGTIENRVTRIGRFLRKSRLDELPQLWNVLMGNLSLVGPRPEFQSAVEKYREEVPFYDVRHFVKPGLSGWAQIHHSQHPHHSVDIRETQNKLQYDLYYIKNRSLILDLAIILKTIRIALRQAGK